MDEGLNAETLYAIGFRRSATWVLENVSLNYQFEAGRKDQLKPLFDVDNALYAFCRGDDVLYIGKTARSLKLRMSGYCRPGKSQITNLRCHEKIKDALARGEEVSILAFTPPGQLEFSGFEINLAAGLEDALIRRFAPPWNGRDRSGAITESAETEAAIDNALSTIDETPAHEIGSFSIKLGPTYYNQGIVNPGVEASKLLGSESETLVVRFEDDAPTVTTRIDRRANKSGAVRFIGGNQAMANWLQRHFRLGDDMRVRILGPNEVEFLLP